MYNDEIRQTIINDLESKAISIVDTTIALTSQGYLVNNSKRTKLDWSSILLHAFENIIMFTEEQQNVIDRIYNKFMLL